MIHYLTGDATQPQGQGIKLIAHIVNDNNKWGAGFVLAISKRWSEPERMYRSLFTEDTKPKLGRVQFVNVCKDDVNEEYIYVVNMIAQHNTGPDKDGNPPIRYDALRTCLEAVNFGANYAGCTTIHMPRIGCGLAGGSWGEVEKIINETLTVDVYVYDLPKSSR